MSSIKQQFNPTASTWLHIDLNSCFATIEQQANPLLRGKPVAVAAYTTPRGCILAPSIEAKRYGVKTGMQVIEGKSLCPDLIILSSDPPKYRFVNRALLNLLNQYTPEVSVRSIDEMLLNFSYLTTQSILAKDCLKNKLINQKMRVTREGGPPEKGSPFEGIFWGKTRGRTRIHNPQGYLITIAREIKTRIKQEIGEWLTVSIGISTNPYLAKLAAGLHKPDGLDEINQHNILRILSEMKLVDLPYIKERNETRLNRVGIKTPTDFYFASTQRLKAAFESIQGHYWHLRLHGYAIDQVEWQRRTIGHSYALPKFTNNITELEQLLCKLVEKMGRRLRKNHLTAQGIHLALNFVDGDFWHKGHKTSHRMYISSDLFLASKQLLDKVVNLKPVRILAVSCFSLEEDLYNQMTLFHDEERRRAVCRALDRVNDKWGEFTVFPANMLTTQQQNKILDRIAFGRVLDMQDVVLQEQTGWEREAYVD